MKVQESNTTWLSQEKEKQKLLVKIIENKDKTATNCPNNRGQDEHVFSGGRALIGPRSGFAADSKAH